MLGLATVVRRADVERLDFHPDLTRIRVWVVYPEYLRTSGPPNSVKPTAIIGPYSSAVPNDRNVPVPWRYS